MKYRLSALGWYNFERLCQVLLQDIIGPGIESFGGSKDSGRDATFKGNASFPNKETPWSGNWVFQVKFSDYEERGIIEAQKILLKSLTKEIDVIVKRRFFLNNIENYILLTNIPLTANSRDKAYQIVASNYSFNFHIIDGKDICNHLDRLPMVRRSFPQLLGLADIEHIVNREHYARAEAFLREWQVKLGTFAVTNSYEKALQKLKQYHFVILDGPPEVGKSTIGAAISLFYLSDGYELVDLRTPSNFHSCYSHDKKQIFIADDAIGSITFNPDLGESWSRDLPGILRLLDLNHKLIWTARKYILEKAIQNTKISELLDNFPSPNEVIIEVSGYTRREKAIILYNHAKNGILSENVKDVLRSLGTVLIDSPNYTPEKIRQLINIILPETENGEKGKEIITNEILLFFKDPSKRWIRAFNALSESEKEFLFALFDLNSKAELEIIKAQYKKRSSSIKNSLSFDISLNMLEHSFVKKQKTYSGKDEIDFQHPSLRDLLLQNIKDNPSARAQYINMTSIDGIIEILGGIGSSEEDHCFILANDTEIDLFAKRIRQLCVSDNPLSKYVTIVSILESHLSKSQDKVPPQITFAVLETFTDKRLFDFSNWSYSDWCKLLEKLYSLMSMIEGTPRIQYIEQLADDFKEADYDDGIVFLSKMYEWEPIIYKRKIWNEKQIEWKGELETSILRHLDETKREMTSDEYEDWLSETQSFEDLLGCLEECNMLSEELVGCCKKIEKIKDRIFIVDDEEEEEGWQGISRSDSEYWTVERIIADI